MSVCSINLDVELQTSPDIKIIKTKKIIIINKNYKQINRRREEETNKKAFFFFFFFPCHSNIPLQAKQPNITHSTAFGMSASSNTLKIYIHS